MKTKLFALLFIISFAFTCSACDSKEIEQPSHPVVDRNDILPKDIIKMTPQDDKYPPILHSDEYEIPVPLPYPVNTSGAEDSPFILPDGNTLYFFFTPDVRIPPTDQLTDNVTGIWVTEKVDGFWANPSRVWLQDPDKIALDGAPFVNDNEIWFASAREGYTDINIFTAQKNDAGFSNWQIADLRFAADLLVGELHLYKNELYYHSDRDGGKGDYDIWMIVKTDNVWSDAENVDIVNTSELDGFPYISPDGTQMWFTRIYMGTPAIYRSYRVDGKWQEPELIVSQFAGEPTLDAAGNLYFIHHYFENNIMIEADIYVAYTKIN